MTEIGKIKENIYKETSPVIIEQGILVKEEDKVFASLVFRNISSKAITSVLIDVHVFDRANRELEVVRDFLYVLEQEQIRDSRFGAETEIEVQSENAKSFSVALRRVNFSDDSIWTGSNSILFETLPLQKTLEQELEEHETIEQYIRDFSNEFAEKSDIIACSVPSEYKDLWFCSCGEINTKADEKCYICGAEYIAQKTHIDNRVQIAANLYEYKEAVKAEEKRRREEALRIAEEERLAKAEKERLEAQARAEEEARLKRKKKIRVITISISIPLVLIIATYIYLLNVFIIPQNNYHNAIELLEAEEYDSAISAFQALNGYSESDRYILEATHLKAQSLIVSENYTEALEILYSIEDSMDVESDINEAKYQLAMIEYDAGNYEEAIEIFSERSSYLDSSDKIQSSYFELTKAYVLEYDLDSAIPYFEKLNEENTMTVQAMFLENGATLYNLGDVEGAEIYFALITEANLLTQVDQVYYDYAVGLMAEGLYDEAIAVFSEVLSYEDSEELIDECEFLKAEELFAQESYAEALVQYELVADYEGASDRINECNYILAGVLASEENYEEAIETYTALGDYEDSATIREQLIYDYGVILFNQGEYVASYEMLYQIQDNEDAYYLLVTKSEYYRYVYDKDLGVHPNKD